MLEAEVGRIIQRDVSLKVSPSPEAGQRLVPFRVLSLLARQACKARSGSCVGTSSSRL